MYDQQSQQMSSQNGATQNGDIPPEIAAQINENDPFQMTLLERLGSLAPEQIAAVKTGVSPAAVAALKVALPEIGFILDRCGQGGAMPGQMPMQGQSAPQPRSALNNI